MLETITIIIHTVLLVLLSLMTIILHKIGTIRKWEIEKEREEAKQPEL